MVEIVNDGTPIAPGDELTIDFEEVPAIFPWFGPESAEEMRGQVESDIRKRSIVFKSTEGTAFLRVREIVAFDMDRIVVEVRGVVVLVENAEEGELRGFEKTASIIAPAITLAVLAVTALAITSYGLREIRRTQRGFTAEEDPRTASSLAFFRAVVVGLLVFGIVRVLKRPAAI